jgi:hypothetical protein
MVITLASPVDDLGLSIGCTDELKSNLIHDVADLMIGVELGQLKLSLDSWLNIDSFLQSIGAIEYSLVNLNN